MNNVKYKLTKREQTDLFIKLAKALSLLHNSEEIAHFLKDLLTEAEVLMLARRLQIAESLIDGLTFDQIRTNLKAGPNTIAKVQTWLELYGEGYRTVINRGSKKDRHENEYSKPFGKLKRKYPLYFWPELLLEEIIKTANKKEKARLLKVAEQLKDKSQLSRELIHLLNS